MDRSWEQPRPRFGTVTSPSATKVPQARSFLDISDWAGPLGRWIAVRLIDTPVTPIHITLGFTLAGLAAAVLFAIGHSLWLAAILLVIKSALDAADGGLARARQRPSRVGRFLDSDCDFVVNVAVYAGLAAGAVGRTGQLYYIALAFATMVTAMLQVSIYNHYYVRYRLAAGGDTTSRVSEDEAAGYAWDDPTLLALLHLLYRLIYGWQDSLVAWLDQTAASSDLPPSRGFMTSVSVLGLGSQLLVIAGCAGLGHPDWALWIIFILFNIYAVGLMLSRRAAARR